MRRDPRAVMYTYVGSTKSVIGKAPLKELQPLLPHAAAPMSRNCDVHRTLGFLIDSQQILNGLAEKY
jgi:hypothetical protein